MNRKMKLFKKLSDKEKLYSQKGVVLGFVRRSDMTNTGEVRCNFVDWKSKTNRRVVESSFQGETHAAFLGHDMGHYLRVLHSEIEIGHEVLFWPEDTPWNLVKHLYMITDCKSVYDAVHKAQQSIGERGVALSVAVLRQLATTSHLNVMKATMLWIPTRHQVADALTKSGKGSQCRSFIQTGRVQFHGKSAREERIQMSKEILVNVGN